MLTAADNFNASHDKRQFVVPAAAVPSIGIQGIFVIVITN